MKRKAKYKKELPHRMYSFFLNYRDAGAPSFSKFARSVGLTLAELEDFRCHKELDRAYRECNEIRRDYLIDCALAKRFDASLVKYLLSCEYGMDEKEESDGGLTVRVEVEGE